MPSCSSHHCASKCNQENAESPQLSEVPIPRLNCKHYQISSLRSCGLRREEGAEGEEAKIRIKLRRSASFQNLSPHRERTQSLFLSNNPSSERADESEAQGEAQLKEEGDSATKNPPPTPKQGVRSWKELLSVRLPPEIPTCLGRGVSASSPALAISQRAGRQQGCCPCQPNQPPQQGQPATPGHSSRSQLTLQASLFHVCPSRFGLKQSQPALSQHIRCHLQLGSKASTLGSSPPGQTDCS